MAGAARDLGERPTDASPDQQREAGRNLAQSLVCLLCAIRERVCLVHKFVARILHIVQEPIEFLRAQMGRMVGGKAV